MTGFIVQYGISQDTQWLCCGAEKIFFSSGSRSTFFLSLFSTSFWQDWNHKSFMLYRVHCAIPYTFFCQDWNHKSFMLYRVHWVIPYTSFCQDWNHKSFMLYAFLFNYTFPLILIGIFYTQVTSWKKDKDRREGKCRCCCLGAELINSLPC